MKVQNKATNEIMTFLGANDNGYEGFNEHGVISTVDPKTVKFIFDPSEEQIMRLIADLALGEGF